MISKRLILCLVGGVLVAPIGIALVLGVARLLGAMGDAAGAAVLERIALGAGILWALDLVCLVAALGFNSLSGPDEPPCEE